METEDECVGEKSSVNIKFKLLWLKANQVKNEVRQNGNTQSLVCFSLLEKYHLRLSFTL